jgi:hypothetical protein
MIDIERQQKLFLTLSKFVKKKINVYAVGGTAMMFYGFKDNTLDIDLVFDNEKERNTFKEAIKEMGYVKMDSNEVYKKKENQPEMFTLGDERFDLFIDKVVLFLFSENMKKRAKQKTYQYGDNFILNIAAPEDIIIMKCATDRAKDREDAKKIIEKFNINWELLISAAEDQVKLGKEIAVMELGCFLEELVVQMKVKIPKEVLDKLFKIFNKQREEKKLL